MSVERARIDPPAVPANKYALPRSSLRFMPRLAREEDHPTAWEFPAWLAGGGDAPPWLSELRELYADPVSFPASISPPAGLLLHALVLNLSPCVAVETGSFVGASTLWIAGALEERSTTSASGAPGGAPRRAVLHCFDDFGPIEPGPWRQRGFEGDRQSLVRARLRRAGVDGFVVLHRGDTGTRLVAARDELRSAGGVDFALLDADHTIAGVTRDLWALEPVLNTGGYLVLHDTIPEQCGGHLGPRHVVDRINEIAQGLYECCELHLAPLNYGLAVLRRIG